MSSAAASPQSRRTGRRPGDSGTRQAITDAARHQFAARGFDAVTVRAIAADAGVDPALVIHFFGSKQGLFTDLIRLPFDPARVVPRLIRPGLDGIGERLARFVLGQVRDPAHGEVLISLLRTAAAQPQAAALLRERYTCDLLEPVAAALEVDQPTLRAALCASQMMGLVVAGEIIGLPPLVDAPTEQLIAIYGATLQRYLTEPLPMGRGADATSPPPIDPTAARPALSPEGSDPRSTSPARR